MPVPASTTRWRLCFMAAPTANAIARCCGRSSCLGRSRVARAKARSIARSGKGVGAEPSAVDMDLPPFSWDGWSWQEPGWAVTPVCRLEWQAG